MLNRSIVASATLKVPTKGGLFASDQLIIMANDKISLPSSGAGITRYFDDLKSKVSFKPQVVLIIIALVAILELILHIYGNSIFGIS